MTGLWIFVGILIGAAIGIGVAYTLLKNQLTKAGREALKKAEISSLAYHAAAATVARNSMAIINILRFGPAGFCGMVALFSVVKAGVFS